MATTNKAKAVGKTTGASWPKKTYRLPDKEIIERVKKEFSADELKEICSMETFEFSKFAEETMVGHQSYFYKDNGSDILGVCHLDSVQDNRKFGLVHTAIGTLAFCPVLDDRLGAYIILKLLPRLGITLDWLLCDDEETGQSTAQFFKTNKKYNSMFEFDRGGTDIVTYQYETKKLEEIVEKFGWRMGLGAFSDISYLDHLGCSGFNVGVSYYDYHGLGAYANISELVISIARFVELYNDYKDVHLKYEYVPPKYGTGLYGKGSNRSLRIQGDGIDEWDEWDEEEEKRYLELYGEYQQDKNAATATTPDEENSTSYWGPTLTFEEVWYNSEHKMPLMIMWEGFKDLFDEVYLSPRMRLSPDELKALAREKRWDMTDYYIEDNDLDDEYQDWAELIELELMIAEYEKAVRDKYPDDAGCEVEQGG